MSWRRQVLVRLARTAVPPPRTLPANNEFLRPHPRRCFLQHRRKHIVLRSTDARHSFYVYSIDCGGHRESGAGQPLSGSDRGVGRTGTGKSPALLSWKTGHFVPSSGSRVILIGSVDVLTTAALVYVSRRESIPEYNDLLNNRNVPNEQTSLDLCSSTYF